MGDGFPFCLKLFEGFGSNVPFRGILKFRRFFAQDFFGFGGVFLLLPDFGIIFIDPVLHSPAQLQITVVDLVIFLFRNGTEGFPLVPEFLKLFGDL